MAGHRVHHVGGVTDQGHARRHHGVRAHQGQRKRAHQLRLQRRELTQFVVAIRGQARGQRVGRFGHQGIGQRIGRRPDEGNAVARQRQQRDDAFAARKPLVGRAMVRLFAGEVADHPALSVGAVIEADVALAAHPRLGAIRTHHQRAGDGVAAIEVHDGRVVRPFQAAGAALHHIDVRREFQGGVQRLAQVAVLDDPRQGIHMGAVGVETESARLRAVAVDQHGVDGRDPVGLQGAPHLQRGQQLVRRVIERIHAHIPTGFDRLDRGCRRTQRG